MNVLDRIIAYKRLEVAASRERVSRRQLEQSLLFDAPRKSFAAELKRGDKAGIIAEFKRRSPSKGWIKEKAEAVEIAKSYEAAGASALSILTDQEFFGGTSADLENAFAATEICPILRKDFVIDEYQIVESRAFGASAILLIAAALSKTEIKSLTKFAASLGLEVLLEVHEENEIPGDLANVSAIGVNNRDLRDFSVDINRSLEIARRLPAEIVKISESGLTDAPTILKLKQAGFDGFLIGETLMKTVDPGAACARLVKEVLDFKF